MNLPNYFLADLPPEATLSPAMITEACQTLKRNRAHYLAQRSTHSLVGVLCGVAEAWLQAGQRLSPAGARKTGRPKTGFSNATLQKGLDNLFRQFTPDNFHALLAQELGDAQRLDRFIENGSREKSNRMALAIGPEFLVHIAAGNLPNPAVMSMVLGLLARSAQFVKCASGSAFLPRLFAHSLYDADPKLGACLEIAEWHGGNAGWKTALFAEADCVTATGSDETLAAIRARLPVKTRFLGYGHRVSFGFVAHEVLSGFYARQIVSRAADDVVAWNQLGCLSPHVIYVQTGGEVSPEKFAERLADELEQREQTEPRGELPAEHAATIASRRGIYEVRAAHAPETTQIGAARIRRRGRSFSRLSPVSIVVPEPVHLCEAGAGSGGGAAKRRNRARPGLDGRPRRAGTQMEELATQLARWGVTRVCPLGQMQNPPLTWRHDGRPALGDLVTWTDLEQSA